MNLGLTAFLTVKVMVLLATCAAVMVSREWVCLDCALEGSRQVRVLSFLTSGELKCSKADWGVGLDWHRRAVNWGGKLLL